MKIVSPLQSKLVFEADTFRKLQIPTWGAGGHNSPSRGSSNGMKLKCVPSFPGLAMPLTLANHRKSPQPTAARSSVPGARWSCSLSGTCSSVGQTRGGL